jgi:hypothetical protein
MTGAMRFIRPIFDGDCDPAAIRANGSGARPSGYEFARGIRDLAPGGARLDFCKKARLSISLIAYSVLGVAAGAIGATLGFWA